MSLLSPDLIYYCGQSIPWDPRSKDLGGSEQAVVELSRHWAKTGLRVEVYGSIPEMMVCDGVTYRPLDQAESTLQADVVVLWRLYGLIGFWKAQHHFQCRLLAVDFHDRELFGHEPLLHQSIDRIQALMFKSRFHAEFLINKLPAEQQAPLRERVQVIPNGIRKQEFMLASPPPREPHRFCYASCYLRGLVPLIQYFWPAVRQLWPDAELHVYYGMEHVRDEAVRDRINTLLQTEGVHDHGRQPVSVISEEKHRSSFHLYYTDSIIETDCISIKESAVAGCIPIISGVNVFAERSGIVMPGNASSEQDYQQAAQAFVNWVQQTSEPDLEKIRQALREVKTHRDWQEAATQWAWELELVAPVIEWQTMASAYKETLLAHENDSAEDPSKDGGNTKEAIKRPRYYCMTSTRHSQHYTDHSIFSFFKHSVFAPRDKFFLIDNDKTYTPIEAHPEVALIRNQTPKSFAENMNSVMKLALADGADFIGLNNDIIFTKDWNRHMAVRGQISVPLCNQYVCGSHGDLQLLPMMSWEDYDGKEDELNEIARKITSHARPIGQSMISFYCFYLPFEVLSEVGLLDEGFGKGGGEDIDYRLRAEHHGFMTRHVHRSFILHFGAKSTWRGGETSEETEARGRQYYAHFCKKWGKEKADRYLAIAFG